MHRIKKDITRHVRWWKIQRSKFGATARKEFFFQTEEKLMKNGVSNQQLSPRNHCSTDVFFFVDVIAFKNNA